MCSIKIVAVQGKLAEAETKLEDLHTAIKNKLAERGSLLMQQAGLDKDAALGQQQDTTKEVE